MGVVFRLTRAVIIFTILTAFTQVGGLIYLAYKPFGIVINRRLEGRKRYLRLLVFTTAYVVFSLIIVPFLAERFGRVPLPLTDSKLKPATNFTWLANRHYVKPELLELLKDTNNDLPENLSIVYLDANFPFLDGFPLIGHLSHNDGEKIDLAFVYSNPNEGYLNDGKSFFGYGVVEPPEQSELNQPKICEDQGYWQYSFTTKFTLLEQSGDYKFDNNANKLLLKKLASDYRTGKIFIEPHLRDRLGLNKFSKVRYHGCHAARHDDHIHLQL
ncbi:MAG: hypothetical protein AAGA64_18095 [Bacteroidota bacterium]